MRFSFPTVISSCEVQTRNLFFICLKVLNMACKRFFCLLYVVITLNALSGLKLGENLPEDFENRDLSKAILEMLHINKLSVPQQAKPHPYMKQIYHLLSTQESRMRSDSDGTLVQSFRSVQGKKLPVYSLAQKTLIFIICKKLHFYFIEVNEVIAVLNSYLYLC